LDLSACGWLQTADIHSTLSAGDHHDDGGKITPARTLDEVRAAL
jgi:hypothetical protein